MNKKISKALENFEKDLKRDINYQSISSEVAQTLGKKEILVVTKDQVNNHINHSLELLNEKLLSFHNQVIIKAVGTVQHIGNGVANISGLPQVGINELVDFTSGVKGLVLNLESDSIDVILLGSEEGIHGGDLVTSSREKISVPVGPDLVGRVINAVGEPLDDLPPINAIDHHYIEAVAPGIIERNPVNEPLHTGIKIIDALFPIGRGQRELIIGDRQTGKTAIAIDTILSQKHTNVTCFYISIGQKKSSISSIIETLKKHDAMDYTTIIASSPDDPPALRYLAPFSGCTMAEYFLNQGQDVLIIYDDLSKHADVYREISLLLRRPPGREAYPGDIFYLHSRLLERACKLNMENGGGSLSALPIISMQQGNISSYIPTNLISICDGQIVLSTDKFNKGFKPAVNIGMSVSRVGGAAQSQAMRSVSNELKLDLSQFEEVEKFTRFGTDLDETTKQQIHRGQILQQLLIQPDNQPLSMADEVIILFAGTNGYLDEIDLELIPEYEQSLLHWLRKYKSDLLKEIDRDKELDFDLKKYLKESLDEFNNIKNHGDLLHE